MSGLIPKETVNVFRSFNDLTVGLIGVDCDLYIPLNLTSLEHGDAYTSPDDLVFKKYPEQKVWIKWAVKDLRQLRKFGIFAEGETPIIGFFANDPDVTIQSYIKVEIEYIPNQFSTDEFEVVDALMKGTYGSEVLRPFKLAPRRKRNPIQGLL